MVSDAFVPRDLLPIVATLSLGIALFVPLRDDRQGRRATYAAQGSPLSAIFATGENVARLEGFTLVTPEAQATETVSERSETSANDDTSGLAHEPDGDEAPQAMQRVFAEAVRAALDRAEVSRAESSFETPEPEASRRPRAGLRGTLGRLMHVVFRATSRREPQPSDEPMVSSEQRANADFADPAPCVETGSAPRLLAADARIREAAECVENAPSSAAPDPRPTAPDALPAFAVEPPTTARDTSSEVTLSVPKRSLPLPTERVVPLTRKRLRPTHETPSWTELLEAPKYALSEEERAALLSRLCLDPQANAAPALERACFEEREGVRGLALDALVRLARPSSVAAFAWTLRFGNDAERAAAVDGLIAISRLDELPLAFHDRCEAIAAKAALAFAETRDREVFAKRLVPLVEPLRYEAIATMLAGVLS